MLHYFLPQSPRAACWQAIVACCLYHAAFFVATGGESTYAGIKHDGYREIAENLLAGNDYVFEAGGPPVIHRPPLYPVFILPIVALPTPAERFMLWLVQSVLLGLIASSIFRLGRRYFSSRAAALAAALTSFNPWILHVVKTPMPFVVQMLLFITLLELLAQQLFPTRNEPAIAPHRWRWLAVGLLCGALALVHGTMLATCGLALIGLAFWSLVRGQFRTAAGAVLAGLLMAAVIAPWTLRNWRTLGEFIPVSGNAGLIYFTGNVHWQLDPVDGPPVGNISTLACRYAGLGDVLDEFQYAGIKSPQLDHELNRRMFAHMRSHPGLVAKKCALNALEFYFPSVYRVLGYTDPFPRWTHVIMVLRTLFHLALWIAAGIGLWRNWSSPSTRRVSLGIGLAIALYVAPYLPFITFYFNNTYTYGTLPLLGLLATQAIWPAAKTRAALLEEH